MIPLVSVITPCYNGANYIAACIESVLAQTLVNWEMLIVDDCSTDNSAEIILSYVKKDTRIRFFQTNKPSGSRREFPGIKNRGIKKCKATDNQIIIHFSSVPLF